MNFKFLFVLFLAGGLIFYFRPQDEQTRSVSAPIITPTLTPALTPTTTPIVIKDFVDVDIDFSPQAPFANWKDPRQQDACEETSALMAVYHRLNKPLTREIALDIILDISKFQTEKYGEYRDTSTADTAERILDGYFNFKNFTIINNISMDDLILELAKGNLVIAPANGRVLKNPYFTPPGPERHMLLIKGYDNNTKEFVTNDPGVGNGKNFRYPMENLYNAIRDYQTGYHIPISQTERNVIIIK